MNVASPDLLTLLAWAEQLAAGQPCAPWEAWSTAAPDAEWKWDRISNAHDIVAGRRQPAEADAALPAEQLAQFIEGRLPLPELQAVEDACWQSSAQLAELVSTVRFMQQSPAVDVSSQLQSRLLGMVPQSKSQHANGKPLKFRLEGAGEAAPAAEGSVFRVQSSGSRSPKSKQANRQLLPVAVVILVTMFLSGTIGWLAATWRHSTLQRQEMAIGPSNSKIERTRDSNANVPPVPVPTFPSSESRLSNDPPHPDAKSDAVVPDANVPPTVTEPESKTSTPPVPPAGTPKYRPRIAPPTPQLAFHSAQGLLLVDPGQRGKLHVAPEKFSLDEPVKVLSLAESWTAAEAPGVGTLIWEGNSEATLSAAPDGAIEIRLLHGRMGIDNLQAGAQIRVQTGEAAWTARASAPNSTFAVVHDPRLPGLLVPRGTVSIDDLNVPGGQVVRWLNGVPQPPEAIASLGTASDASQHSTMPPPMNPWEVSWLQRPDENTTKQWRAVHGRMVDRLAQSDDVAAELPKLLATTRDARQTALVARWNIAAVASAARAQQIWTFLTDRRPGYRIAGVKSILEMHPGDERLSDVAAVLKTNVGAATADRVEQWIVAAWQPGPPNKLQSAELVEALMHNELAVRQIAVSMLELHTEGVLRLARTPFPAYDAASSRTARQMGQAQWNAIMTRLYTPNRKEPNFVNPPAASPQRPSPQNATPLDATKAGT